MKNFIGLLLIVALSALMASCLKKVDGVSPAPSITGDWHIVNDTTSTSFWGLWAGMQPTGTNYAGQTGDHYNFTADGKLYIKENTSIDTATYKMLTNNKVEFNYLYNNGFTVNATAPEVSDYTVSNLTANKMTLVSGEFITPESVIQHTIYLKK